MTYLILKSCTVNGRRTSIRLEPCAWTLLDEVMAREHCDRPTIVTALSSGKAEGQSLTSAIREFLMLYFREAATKEGHSAAGHGDLRRLQRQALDKAA